jgi:hypothetical protein
MEPFSAEGETVDLDAIYARMFQEACDDGRGRLVHSRGLKHVLADLYGFELRGPRRRLQPSRERMRKRVVDKLIRRRWIRESDRKNSAHYELIRSS